MTPFQTRFDSSGTKSCARIALRTSFLGLSSESGGEACCSLIGEVLLYVTLAAATFFIFYVIRWLKIVSVIDRVAQGPANESWRIRCIILSVSNLSWNLSLNWQCGRVEYSSGTLAPLIINATNENKRANEGLLFGVTLGPLASSFSCHTTHNIICHICHTTHTCIISVG